MGRGPVAQHMESGSRRAHTLLRVNRTLCVFMTLPPLGPGLVARSDTCAHPTTRSQSPQSASGSERSGLWARPRIPVKTPPGRRSQRTLLGTRLARMSARGGGPGSGYAKYLIFVAGTPARHLWIPPHGACPLLDPAENAMSGGA